MDKNNSKDAVDMWTMYTYELLSGSITPLILILLSNLHNLEERERERVV